MAYQSDTEYVEAIRQEVAQWDNNKKQVFLAALWPVTFIVLFMLFVSNMEKIVPVANANILSVTMGLVVGIAVGPMLHGIVNMWAMVANNRLMELLIQHFDANPNPPGKTGEFTGAQKGVWTSKGSRAELNDAQVVEDCRKQLRTLKKLFPFFFAFIVLLLLWFLWTILPMGKLLPNLAGQRGILTAAFFIGMVSSYMFVSRYSKIIIRIINPLFSNYRLERILILHFDEELAERF